MMLCMYSRDATQSLLSAALRIRIDLMQIRIQLFNWMQIYADPDAGSTGT
jgi:hypothetical protein